MAPIAREAKTGVRRVANYIIGGLALFSAFLPATGALAANTAITIDTASTTVPYVDRGVLGGNTMNDTVLDYHYSIFRELGGNLWPNGKNLNRPLWRVHMQDKGQPKNYWMYNPDLRRRANGLYNPMIPETDPQYNWHAQYPLYTMDLTYENKPDGETSGNYYTIERYDHSPTYSTITNRHSISYTKMPGSTLQKHRIFNDPNRNLPIPAGPTYTRFDFKLSSAIPFIVKNKAFLMRTAKLELFLNPNRTLEVRVGHPTYQAIMTYATPLNFDQWYSMEIMTATTSIWWLNGKKIAQVNVGALSASTAALNTEIDAGTLVEGGAYATITTSTQINDSYQYKLDELEMRTRYIGLNPSFPLNRAATQKFNDDVIVAYSFETLPTLDDYAFLAEKNHLELVLQLPNPCETAYGCASDSNTGLFKDFYSVRGLTAMLQYLTGQADVDYENKAKEIVTAGWPLVNLKKANGTGYYNYANLRASRGRLNPYNLSYVEVGNEPYYAEYSNHNENGFAARFIAVCESLKSIRPALKCILPAQDSATFSLEKVLQYITSKNKSALVAGIAIHDYFQYLPYDRARDYPLRAMAGLYADAGRYTRAKKLTDKYLGALPNYKTNFVFWINEYNSILRDFKNNRTDKFIDAAYAWSELAYMLEHGITGGSLFFWNSATPGESYVNGLVGDYNMKPRVTLNGQTFLAFSRYFGWGGKMVAVSYDPITIYDPITRANVPLVSVLSSLSSDGSTLYVAMLNRDRLPHTYDMNLKNFVPQPAALQYRLIAANVLDAAPAINYASSSVAVGANFKYTLPGQSITFLKITK